MAELDPLTRLIKRRHPEYEDRLEHWDFLESCYEGGRDWFADNIFKYFKEGETEFKDRIDRAYRFNHSREVVDLVNKYLFRAAISRKEEDASDAVKAFWKKATKNGQNIDYFIRQVSKRSSVQGRIYVVVDNNARVAPKNKAEEKEAGVRTYAYIVKPQDVLDMSFDEMGQLHWILIREFYRDDADPLGEDLCVEPRYRLWTRHDWKLFVIEQEKSGKSKGKEKVVLSDQGVHDLGMVPVIPVDHTEDDNPYFTPALINDIAYLDRAVGNYLSNLDAIIQDQTFSQLAMPAQGLLPGDEASTKKQLLELGTKRVFLYNGEAGAVPVFLSPDPRQAELIITAIRTIINEIYHTVGMAGERTKQDNAMGIDNSSGVAKAYDFDRVNALLNSKAKGLECVENAIADLVNRWNGADPEEPTEPVVKYSDDFDVRGLLDEFDIAQRLSLISAPDEVRRKQMETLIEKLFPSLGKALKEEMINSLKEWPPQDPLTVPGEGGPTPTSAKRPTQGSNQSQE